MDSIIELAHALGPYAICGEGNVSGKFSDEYRTCFFVKASGTSLDTLEKDQLVGCQLNGVPFDSSGLKPSIETSFHSWFHSEFDEVKFVAHTHPPKTMQILCSEQIHSFAEHRLFPDQVVRNGRKSCVVPYGKPGRPLLYNIRTSVLEFIQREKYFPKLILLQNHGIIVASSSHKDCIASTMMCEKSAEIFIGSHLLGQAEYLSENEIREVDGCPNEKYRKEMIK
ncbi:MAG: class II aldolase/adducin family protein [Candidatus Poseidoniales archaeon]